MNKAGYAFATLKSTLASDTNWKNCQVIEYTTASTIAA
jgi:hypothetical protein